MDTRIRTGRNLYITIPAPRRDWYTTHHYVADNLTASHVLFASKLDIISGGGSGDAVTIRVFGSLANLVNLVVTPNLRRGGGMSRV